MVSCKFVRIDESTIKCEVCGNAAKHAGEGQLFRNCHIAINRISYPETISPTCRFRTDTLGEDSYSCLMNGQCSMKVDLGDRAFCPSCNLREPLPSETPVMKRKWAYGITTVPQRRHNTFARTLTSLKEAGFDKPRLFIDGHPTGDIYAELGLEMTVRYPTIRTFGNWALSLAELYIRDPNADVYAIFQDDFITYRNLRQYLDQCEYPAKGYWNLYTFPSNQKIAPPDYAGWYASNQMGKGAVALVFSREAVCILLGMPHFVNRPLDCVRGHRSVDGGVVTAMQKAGWREFVHTPSLVQHIGQMSSMQSKPQPMATSFMGEAFDATSLLSCPSAHS